jgi:hypothetical protein
LFHAKLKSPSSGRFTSARRRNVRREGGSWQTACRSCMSMTRRLLKCSSYLTARRSSKRTGDEATVESSSSSSSSRRCWRHLFISNGSAGGVTREVVLTSLPLAQLQQQMHDAPLDMPVVRVRLSGGERSWAANWIRGCSCRQQRRRGVGVSEVRARAGRHGLQLLGPVGHEDTALGGGDLGD